MFCKSALLTTESAAPLPESEESLRMDLYDDQRRFILWAADVLDLPCRRRADGSWELHLPTDAHERFGGVERIRLFEAGAATSGAESGAESSAESRMPAGEGCADAAGLIQWLVDLLRDRDEPIFCEPQSQPRSVHELTDRLFRAYTIDGGTVHLAGCTLEDRPLLRLTFRRAAPEGQDRIQDVFFDPQSRQLDDGFIESLGLADIRLLRRDPPKADVRSLQRWQTEAAAVLGARDLQIDVIGGAIVWCKYAEGKLRFAIGDASVDLPFADWATTLVAPPFVCALSGRRSYHLSATDDGRVAAAESIAVCEETGTRSLESDLVLCSATGKKVLAEQTAHCPVTGEPVLRHAMVECSACRQKVSPASVVRGKCRACRVPLRAGRSDQVFSHILSRHPGLSREPHWRRSETRDVHILIARSLMHRLLVVLDRETLLPLRVARRSFLARDFTDLDRSQWDDLLAGS